jgi:hypothetical protein
VVMSKIKEHYEFIEIMIDHGNELVCFPNMFRQTHIVLRWDT